jgi:hypothetical protein
MRGLLAIVACALVALAASPARAQDGPAPTAPAPSTTVADPVSPPPTAPPPTEPSPPGAAPPVDPGPPPDESTEIDVPDAVVVQRGPAPPPPPRSRSGGAVDSGLVAAARADLARRIAEGRDALAVARETEASLVAELAATDERMAGLQQDLAAALDQRDVAAAAAGLARAAAEEAEQRARDRRAELGRLAVSMYIDPPQELVVATALRGEVRERLAARSMLAARTEVVRRGVAAARDAARTALRRAGEASAALRGAEEAARQADEARAALQAEADGRRAALEAARVTLAAIEAEVGALAANDAALASRLAVQQLSRSGSLVVRVAADGTWSVEPVGFPGPGEVVRLPGTSISVHRAIAGQVAALVAEARAAGVPLDGWGYRDTARQIELRRAHCGEGVAAVFEAPAGSCRPPTARPGRSMHERGLAVDFKNSSTRATPCYQWLAANAARFGLFNLPSEPWHWSTDGN